MEEEGKNLGSHFQVMNEGINYNWKIAGFNAIPFWDDHPVASSVFVLCELNGSEWQMLMVKELRCKRNCSCSECKVPDENEAREIETDLALEDFEIISGPSSLESEIKPKCRDRALGFKIITVSEGLTWEAIEYYIQLTIGDVKKTTKQRTQPGVVNCKPAYLYLYESDFEGLDLDNVETIQVDAFIQYTFLDQNILEPAVSDRKKISKDIYQLLETQKHSDVLLKAGDVEIAAHKAILCSRSYAFDSMLQEDHAHLKERLSLDLDENVASALLSYIYCGGIPVEFPLVKCTALCAAADKYQVDGLKAIVNKFFKKNLDLEACFQCLSCDDSEFDLMSIPENKLKIVLLKEICDHKSEIEA